MEERVVDVIGAGIGGLTAARAMHTRGWKVRVHERAPELRATGAGIIIQPNAMRAFDALGLGDRVRSTGFALRGMKVLSMRGDLLSRVDLTGYGEAWTVDRGALLRELAQASGAEVHTSSAFDTLDATGPRVAWSDASGATHRADALLGADGLYSRVRQSLFGTGGIRYAGYTVWRGVAGWSHGGLGAYMGEYWGPAKRFGIVPLSGGRTYWYAVEDTPEGGEDGDDPVAELVARFEGWDPACADVLRATPAQAVMRHDCHDLAPVHTWGEGHVALVGDAAHAMTPNLGQGGCQAIEDGLALALALDAHPDDLPAALRAYASSRRDRAHMFVRRSWDVGKVSQWQGRVTRAVRDLGMRWTPKWALTRQLGQVYTPTGLA